MRAESFLRRCARARSVFHAWSSKRYSPPNFDAVYRLTVLYYFRFSFTIDETENPFGKDEHTHGSEGQGARGARAGARRKASGGRLAETLGVSRAAVHKAISMLRADGLAIDGVPGEGYRLACDDDSLTAAGVEALLQTRCIGREIVVVPSLTSTNTVMKEQYLDRPHGFVLAAEEQTGGRGRLGRTFVSPSGTGVYFTILLHPALPLTHIQYATLAAAVAVTRAVSDTAGFTPEIKWVNDVLMQGKKLNGTLTEAVIEGESGTVSSLIVGIGINLRPNPAWPEEVRRVAGAISDFGPVPRRAALIASVLTHFEQAYSLVEQGREGELVALYRERLCCIGRKITVVSPLEKYEAECVGLDGEGHLLIRTADGAETTLSTGEISIRL
ncbi:biotin--[acetyl-CoA-carboxylase] ligase [Butyricicoccus sp. AM29-23AC]|nr:biotin--[acetyl-CoA-carboxylase] ligase [Butyricicoccus sp. AM29-23AC]